MNLKYMNVSLFEITYKKKITFSRHSNLLRCTCISILTFSKKNYVVDKAAIPINTVCMRQLKHSSLISTHMNCLLLLIEAYFTWCPHQRQEDRLLTGSIWSGGRILLSVISVNNSIQHIKFHQHQKETCGASLSAHRMFLTAACSGWLRNAF